MCERCGPELALHLRASELSGRSLYTVATSVCADAAAGGGWCVVNGRLDVGLAAAAQAVQLGHTALPVARARRVAGDRLWLGASVHSVAEAVQEARYGANYLVLGTIHPTPSHPGHRGAGPGLIEATRATLNAAGFEHVGLVAIGGIDAGNVAEALAAGAAGVAVQRAVWGRADPATAAEQLLKTARQGQRAT